MITESNTLHNFFVEMQRNLFKPNISREEVIRISEEQFEKLKTIFEKRNESAKFPEEIKKNNEYIAQAAALKDRLVSNVDAYVQDMRKPRP